MKNRKVRHSLFLLIVSTLILTTLTLTNVAAADCRPHTTIASYTGPDGLTIPRGEEADVTIVITASPKNENPTTWLLTPGTTIFTNATGDRKLAPRSKTLASVTLVQEITFIDEFDDISVNRFTIEPGEDRTITFTFCPSKDTPVGTYNFTYHLETLDLEPSYWYTIDSIKIHVI